MRRSLISLSAGVVGLSLTVAQVVHAQGAAGQATGNGAAAAAAGDQLQEVVVTAEKVQESEQRTPISMEVYNAQSLAQHDITTVQSLVAIDPSLNAVGPTGYLALRGVASFDTTEIGNPSVPVVIDDFSTNRFFGLEVSMFDLQRIEVLRGPQGTLYGRSATGGVINIITNKPTKEFEATGSTEYGTYNWFQTTGTINVPAASWLQLRAAFQTQRNDGYHGSLTGTKGFDVSGLTPTDVNQRGDDTDNRAGRVQAAFEAGNSFTGLLEFEDIWVGGIGPVTENIPLIFPPGLNGDITHQKPALYPPGSFPVYGEPWQRINQKVGKWNLAYSGLPGGMTLTFLGGYGLIEYHSLGVGSNAYKGLADPSSPFFPYLPPRQYNNNQEPHDINSELRLTSGTQSALTWQTGLYFFQEDNTLNNRGIYAAGATGLSLPAGAPGLAGIQPGGDYIEFPFPEIRQASHAAYGQGSYAINDKNKITLGVRYSEDWVLRTGTANIIVAHLYGLPQYGTAFSNRITWHAGYDLQMTPQNLLYAKVDSGYKPGGFDTCGTYNPESVMTGEIGTKNRLADQRVQLNGDVFYDDYTDQQVSEFTSTCITATHTTNAGRSRIYGAEADLTTLITPVDHFDLSGSYLNARYVTFLNPPTLGPAALNTPLHPDPYCTNVVTVKGNGECDLSGNTLPFSPTLSVTAALEHDWMLGDSSLNLRLEGKWNSKQYFSPFDYPDSEQGAYGTMNAYLDYVHDNWQIGVWARNLTNTVYLTTGGENTGGGVSQYTYAYGAPRTLGVRFQAEVH